MTGHSENDLKKPRQGSPQPKKQPLHAGTETRTRRSQTRSRRRAVLVDGHTLRALLLVGRVHVVDEGQRHLIDVGALVGQVAAELAAGSARGRVAHELRDGLHAYSTALVRNLLTTYYLLLKKPRQAAREG